MTPARPLLVALLTSLPAAPCIARIGESKLECVERYGTPVKTVAAELVKSDADADVFEFGGLKIVVEYRDGKAWLLSYAGKGLNKEDVEGLLAKNSGEAAWKSGKFLDAQHWIAREQGLHAVHFIYPTRRLVVMTKASLKADRHPRRKLAAEEEGDGDGEAADAAAEGEEKKPTGKPDRLEGF